MADKKISALTAATTPLDGTEVLPIVQSGATVKVANNDLRPKQIQSNATSGVLQVAGPASAATRVMTTPDANFTAARTDAAQTFTDVQTFTEVNTNLYIESGFQTFSSTNYYYAQLRLKDTNNRTTILTSPNPLSINGQVGTSSGHAFDILTNNAIRMSFHESNGNATLSTGNLVQGTAAKGINFTANTPAAGMTSQLLNWYEEGAWTPVVTSSAGSITSYTSSGLYTRVGRQITAVFKVNITNNGTGTGALYVTVPFTPSTTVSIGAGRENAVTGSMLQIVTIASDVRTIVYTYNNLYPVTTGSEVLATVSYFV